MASSEERLCQHVERVCRDDGIRVKYEALGVHPILFQYKFISTICWWS